MEEFKRSNAPGYQSLPAEKIFYHEGNLQFWYRDFTAAEQNLRKVTAKAGELDLNTGVLAWMRLGQTYDMLGRRGDAQAAYQEAIQLAPQSELARESKRYLASPYRRTQS
jgi:Flp pilus assembly protein TadD